MRGISKPIVGLFSAIAGGLTAILVISELPADQIMTRGATGEAVKINVQGAPQDRTPKLYSSFAPAVQKAAPSVVNIYSTRTVQEPSNPVLNNPLFRHFFGDELSGRLDSHGHRKRSQSLGSGVICTPDGYILTDYHVIEGAEEIKVGLADGRTEFTGKLIGTDPDTDVAVVKIDATNLPAITMGDSDRLQIGDVVLAVGNPFGLGQTVTMGIASATGRGGFGIEDIENFIQTDASINPGNSGGALVDAEGRLVGLNTAILSRTGGNQGIGFAVPINLAREVMGHILQDGRVIRGYLGVAIQPLTPELAKAFHLPTEQTGALVGGVSPNSPAAHAGFKEGDVITEYNGKKVTDSRQLGLFISESSPKAQASMKILRNGREQGMGATLAEKPHPKAVAEANTAPTPTGRDNSGSLDAVTVADLNTQVRQTLEIPPDVHGAVVAKVEPGSNSYIAGLRPGDVITHINGQPVSDANEAVQLSRKADDKQTLLHVWSKEGSHYVAVENKAEPAP